MTAAREQNLNRLRNAPENGHAAPQFMHYNGRRRHGGYMKFTGDRPGRQEKGEWGDLWHWIESKM